MDLFKNIVMVILSPGEGWADVNTKGIPTSRVLSGAFYPLLAVMAITAFVPMVYDHTITLERSLMQAIVLFSSYFITYFASNFLLAGFYPELVKTKGAEARATHRLYAHLFPDALHAVDCFPRLGGIGHRQGETHNLPHFFHLTFNTHTAVDQLPVEYAHHSLSTSSFFGTK